MAIVDKGYKVHHPCRLVFCARYFEKETTAILKMRATIRKSFTKGHLWVKRGLLVHKGLVKSLSQI